MRSALKTRRPARALEHLRGGKTPGRGGFRLGQRIIEDAAAITVHAQRRDRMAPGVDHHDGVALPLCGGMRSASATMAWANCALSVGADCAGNGATVIAAATNRMRRINFLRHCEER
jgi:hypothetical protein